MLSWGKIIGFIFGFRIFGLFGGVLGALVGSLFDHGLAINLKTPHRKATIEEAFFETTFLVLGYLAKADGVVTEAEIAIATKAMARLELNEMQKRVAINLFNRGKSNDFILADSLQKLRASCKYDVALLQFFLELQFEMAYANSVNRNAKLSALQQICQLLGVRLNNFNYYNNDYRSYNTEANETSSLSEAYKVLGLSAQATIADIKKAYRKLMNQHHPDKLKSRGLPDSMLKIAKEKTQKISAAYDKIRKARGFK